MLRAAAERGLALSEASDFAALAGKGVAGVVEGHGVLIGSGLMGERGLDVSVLQAEAEAQRALGATVVFVAIDGRSAGLIAIADPLRDSAPAAIEALRRQGLRLVMLTGDHRATAQAIAGRLGIDEVEAEVLPGDKAAAVQRLKAQGRVVAMAGDGINDAPALAAADVGLAMGAGADVGGG